MIPNAAKAVDASMLDLMALHIGKNITGLYTQEALDGMGALMAKLDEANKRCTALEVECATLRAEKAAMAGDEKNSAAMQTALQVAKSESSAARAECANLRSQVSKLEARVESLESEDATEVETDTPEEPMEYDIEVIRGGDDRIRSLRVRCTE